MFSNNHQIFVVSNDESMSPTYVVRLALNRSWKSLSNLRFFFMFLLHEMEVCIYIFNDSGICSPSERPEYRETERFYGGFCNLVENKPVRNQCNAAKHVCMDRITALDVYTLENFPYVYS